MHRSRLAGFIIDAQSSDLDGAAAFWGGALGMKTSRSSVPSYMVLDSSARDLAMEVQLVEHASRVHLDVETDDLEREVARLEALGARRAEKINHWWVMEAPTGHRFCVVQSKHSLEGKPGINEWP